ncbi:uncharacterized protein LOC129752365 [Uranotaenia lowii]|uniref:uncharacterized protein LOC129752365 n=1 Tax=Uranotaenia lowii TaxID=190385 RepID=UPI00247964B7|nr:uncharacterized protein LOC129752365 [Uranotaenia lowii]
MTKSLIFPNATKKTNEMDKLATGMERTSYGTKATEAAEKTASESVLTQVKINNIFRKPEKNCEEEFMLSFSVSGLTYECHGTWKERTPKSVISETSMEGFSTEFLSDLSDIQFNDDYWIFGINSEAECI